MGQFPDERGYAIINMRTDSGQRRGVGIHRLLALAFIPNPFGLSDVAHNDGNPSNNRLNNLRWCSHRENQMDMRRHGTMQDGEKCITAKLTESNVREIIAACASGHRGTQRRMAEKFGIGPPQINRIVKRTAWSHLDI